MCEDCGLIIDEQQIDPGPEWRSYDRSERKRTGAPVTAARHDRGLTTKIGWCTDANGNSLPTQKRRQLSRLRREHARTQQRSKTERNLAYGLTEVRRIVGALGLAREIRDQACRLSRTAQAENLLYGRSIEAIAAGASTVPAGTTGSRGHSTTSSLRTLARVFLGLDVFVERRLVDLTSHHAYHAGVAVATTPRPSMGTKNSAAAEREMQEKNVSVRQYFRQLTRGGGLASVLSQQNASVRYGD